MSTRPSNNTFLEWVRNDQNKTKVQNALRAHPDLANYKDSVSFFWLFSHSILIVMQKALMVKQILLPYAWLRLLSTMRWIQWQVSGHLMQISRIKSHQQLRNIINIFHCFLSFRSLQFWQSYSEEYKVFWRKLCLQENFVCFSVTLPKIVNIWRCRRMCKSSWISRFFV